MSVRAWCVAIPLGVFLCSGASFAQSSADSDLMASYSALRSFMLNGGDAKVSDLVLKRDRAEMTFTGMFYFSKPVLGKITGAVFVGEGKFRAEPPPILFEKQNLHRMLDADIVESDFKTAVLRFTDDTYSVIGKSHEPTGTAPKDVQDLASEMETRTTRETGINFASRLLQSLANSETPGVFIAQFDKGRRGRFTLVLDMQCRIPTVYFSINAGEKGLIFAYNKTLSDNDVWLAFHSEKDYAGGTTAFSDLFDQIATSHYEMKVDLREPQKILKVNARMDVQALNPLRAISYALTEGLPEADSLRKKNGMRVTAARLADGKALQKIQEEWESGFLVLLPEVRKAEEKFTIETDVEGDFIRNLGGVLDCQYPMINGEWYPRHGYLRRSKFDIVFLHNKKYKVSGPGERIKEEPSSTGPNDLVTTYRMTEPVALVTFAMGPFKIYQETRKMQKTEIPIEFFSLAGMQAVSGTRSVTIKEDFILAEMGNALEYLSAMFGPYPYPIFRAAYHPFGFGQGFATMLAIPNADSANPRTYAFISHETSHQWWGNIVAWRSYRDQWLSEGFAEYSGVLYILNRTKKSGDVKDALNELRNSLKEPPSTTTGIGSKRVVDIGPLILGQRLRSRESLNAYQTLTYNKGALVLRMLHFLFTNPTTGDGQPFFDMMRNFVDRYRNSSASTEDFEAVASEYYARTPVAQKYGVKDLHWFFSQWVMQTALPTYRLEYSIQNNPDGSATVQGTVFQENAPENWAMPLPLMFKFSGNQVARGTILANGPQQPVTIRLPQKPESVELDPEHWVLSEKTTTKKK
jgi:hypothetical protein